MAAFAVLVLVFASGAFFSLLPAAPSGGSQPLALASWLLVYVVGAVLLVDGRLRMRLPIPAPVPLLLFVALASASTLWSVSPDVTTRRSIGLAGTVIVGLMLAQRLRPLDLLEALRRAMLVVALASLVLYVVGHPSALDDLHGTLQGVTAHKNTLGRFMALGLIVTAALMIADRSRRVRCAASAAPMLLALALTGSTGGILVAFLGLLAAATVALRTTAPGSRLLAGLGASAAGFVLLVLPMLSLEAVTGLVGRDATLTGRDQIWRESLAAVPDALLLGHGYGAFWADSESAERIRARLQFDVANGHNGLLDAGLDLGLLGAALGLLLVLALLVKGVQDAVAGQRDAAALRLSVAAVVVLSNLAESGLLEQNTLLAVLHVAALAVPRAARRGSRETRSQ